MVAVFVFGLAAITGLIGMMKAVLNLNVGLIVAFTVLSFLIMLLVEGVCLRLLFRRNRSAEEGATTLSKKQATKELTAAQTRVLPNPCQASPSTLPARLSLSTTTEHQNELTTFAG